MSVGSVGVYLVTTGDTFALTGSSAFSGAVLLIICGGVTSIVALGGVLGAVGLWWPILILVGEGE